MTIADIELHDLPVNTITIDFTTGKVLINCAIYDEEKQCHKNVSVQRQLFYCYKFHNRIFKTRV